MGMYLHVYVCLLCFRVVCSVCVCVCMCTERLIHACGDKVVSDCRWLLCVIASAITPCPLLEGTTVKWTLTISWFSM